MPDLWMPGAARHAVGNTGAMNGGPARAVWHITSNAKDWTYKNELGWFTGGGREVAPHLLWDPFTGQIAQFFPADSRSLSLQNAGTVKTNRTGKYCVQIETVFTAGETVNGKRYATVRDTPCKGLDQIMGWLRSLGIPDTWPGGAPTAFARDTVSLSTWLAEPGHFGHNQVPGNSHVDPGPMPNLAAIGKTQTTKPSTGKPKYEPFPGASFFRSGHRSPVIAAMHKRLVAEGCNKYASSADADVWGSGDERSYAAWQRKLGYAGADADGKPGPTSWAKLHVPNS
ncbi:peptidoglycan-binding protein [Streptomyces bauhiniae]|uniref:peptidoglycan-binding protein n=1 Tax=Streptomyces bauhiniae TaxID=2340725 RepID=UPI0033A28D1B